MGSAINILIALLAINGNGGGGRKHRGGQAKQRGEGKGTVVNLHPKVAVVLRGKHFYWGCDADAFRLQMTAAKSQNKQLFKPLVDQGHTLDFYFALKYPAECSVAQTEQYLSTHRELGRIIPFNVSGKPAVAFRKSLLETWHFSQGTTQWYDWGELGSDDFRDKFPYDFLIMLRHDIVFFIALPEFKGTMKGRLDPHRLTFAAKLNKGALLGEMWAKYNATADDMHIVPKRHFKIWVDVIGYRADEPELQGSFCCFHRQCPQQGGRLCYNPIASRIGPAQVGFADIKSGYMLGPMLITTAKARQMDKKFHEDEENGDD